MASEDKTETPSTAPKKINLLEEGKALQEATDKQPTANGCQRDLQGHPLVSPPALNDTAPNNTHLDEEIRRKVLEGVEGRRAKRGVRKTTSVNEQHQDHNYSKRTRTPAQETSGAINQQQKHTRVEHSQTPTKPAASHLDNEIRQKVLEAVEKHLVIRVAKKVPGVHKQQRHANSKRHQTPTQETSDAVDKDEKHTNVEDPKIPRRPEVRHLDSEIREKVLEAVERRLATRLAKTSGVYKQQNHTDSERPQTPTMETSGAVDQDEKHTNVEGPKIPRRPEVRHLDSEIRDKVLEAVERRLAIGTAKIAGVHKQETSDAVDQHKEHANVERPKTPRKTAIRHLDREIREKVLKAAQKRLLINLVKMFSVSKQQKHYDSKQSQTTQETSGDIDQQKENTNVERPQISRKTEVRHLDGEIRRKVLEAAEKRLAIQSHREDFRPSPVAEIQLL